MLAESFAGIVSQCVGRGLVFPRRITGVDVESMRAVSSVCTFKQKSWNFPSETVVEESTNRTGLKSGRRRSRSRQRAIPRARGTGWARRIQDRRARKIHARTCQLSKGNIGGDITDGQAIGKTLGKAAREADDTADSGTVNVVLHRRETVLNQSPLRSKNVGAP